jgi:hypothetical protein
MFHRVRRDKVGDDVVMRLVIFAVGELEAMRAKKDDVKLRCGTPKGSQSLQAGSSLLGTVQDRQWWGRGTLQPQIPSGAR